jgi:purine-cytosine permease-like protein
MQIYEKHETSSECLMYLFVNLFLSLSLSLFLSLWNINIINLYDTHFLWLMFRYNFKNKMLLKMIND